MTAASVPLRLRAALASPVLLALLLPAPATATSYQALCGNNPCTINFDANGIGGLNTFIPIGRIARWYTGGQESYDSTNGTVGAVGGGTAGAIAGGILLGPVGLVGGMVGAPWPDHGRARRRISTSPWWVTTAPATRPRSTSAS